MSTGFLDKLIDLLMSPLGLAGVGLGVFIVSKARRSRPLAWLLIGLCAFAASLAKFKDEFISEPPPLVFPLQQLREVGRPLSILFLVLLIILALQSQNGWRHRLLPLPIAFLSLVQITILLKSLQYGNIGFALLAALTFGGMIWMMIAGPSRWLQDHQNFIWAVRAIAISGIIFLITNLYQYIIDSSAVTFVHGRFLGTTGNPQHAAVLLACSIPCFMFMIEFSKEWNWIKLSWIAGLGATLFFLFLTGSRTGALMGVFSVLFFYRQKGSSWVRFGLILLALATMLSFLGGETFLSSFVDLSVLNRFSSTESNRDLVWQAQLNSFSNYPLLGAPSVGERLGFGENSWLAAAASLGLVGLVPMFLFGISCLRQIWQLHKLSQRRPGYFLPCSTVIAGLASLMVGSFFEGYLLGNITFPLIVLLVYLILGQYLLEVDRAQRRPVESYIELSNQESVV